MISKNFKSKRIHLLLILMHIFIVLVLIFPVEEKVDYFNKKIRSNLDEILFYKTSKNKFNYYDKSIYFIKISPTQFFQFRKKLLLFLKQNNLLVSKNMDKHQKFGSNQKMNSIDVVLKGKYQYFLKLLNWISKQEGLLIQSFQLEVTTQPKNTKNPDLKGTIHFVFAISSK
ncbi:MAG: hypothetical protein ACI86H_000589 [bacterium]|jgi:hypothetical protein